VNAQFRLKRNQDFQIVIHKQKRKSNDLLVMYVSENDLHHPRVGISTSKKIGNAVIRNRARRQMRSLLLKNLNLTSSYDIVFIVKAAFVEANHQSRHNRLVQLLQYIGGQERT
jgi:ribonuclease P protein component